MFVVRRVLVLVAVLILAVLAATGAASAGEPAATRDTPVARAAVSTPEPAPAARSATPCAVTARACVDLSSRLAWITDGKGRVLYGPVAARGGKKGAATPVGTFGVSAKVRNYHSREFDAPMPYSVFFVPGIAFHQGSPSVASNGCIHLTRSAARAFFAALRAGDRVQVVG